MTPAPNKKSHLLLVAPFFGTTKLPPTSQIQAAFLLFPLGGARMGAVGSLTMGCLHLSRQNKHMAGTLLGNYNL